MFSLDEVLFLTPEDIKVLYLFLFHLQNSNKVTFSDWDGLTKIYDRLHEYHEEAKPAA